MLAVVPALTETKFSHWPSLPGFRLHEKLGLSLLGRGTIWQEILVRVIISQT